MLRTIDNSKTTIILKQPKRNQLNFLRWLRVIAARRLFIERVDTRVADESCSSAFGTNCAGIAKIGGAAVT